MHQGGRQGGREGGGENEVTGLLVVSHAVLPSQRSHHGIVRVGPAGSIQLALREGDLGLVLSV